MSTTPLIEDIRIRRGARHILGRLLVLDLADEPVDLTGRSVRVIFRSHAASTVVELDASAGVELRADVGELQVQMTKEQTAELGRRGVWDLSIDDLVVWEGHYTATERISR